MAGRFITFEGIDGSGKSTQIHLLGDEFNKIELPFKIFREPGGTLLSEKIRSILLDRENIDLTANSESMLFAAARAQLVEKEIKPALRKNIWVICDRFADSTIAYQGYGRGLNINKLMELNGIATAETQPDVTFMLDLAPEQAAQRRMNETQDRLESSGLEFFKKVREGYHQITLENQDRCYKMNANQPPEKLFIEIIKVIKNRFAKDIACG